MSSSNISAPSLIALWKLTIVFSGDKPKPPLCAIFSTLF